MMIWLHFIWCFWRKKTFPTLGFEPVISWVKSSSLDLTFWIISLIVYLAPICSLGDIVEVILTPTAVTSNITQSLYIQ